MGITLQAIANDLDISAATVSRSLRHDKLIHPETRARVNEAATRLGYQGRARRPRRVAPKETGSRTLGLLLRHNSIDAARHDVNLMNMMSGIMAVADAGRMALQIHAIHHEEERHMDEDPSVIPAMIQHGVCQAFIVHGEQDERDLAFLTKRACVVSMGRVYASLPIDAAVGDNVEGVRAIVAHLVELGHRRLAWAGTGYTASFTQARQAGFIQGCLEHRLEFGPQSFFGNELYGGPNTRDPNAVKRALSSGVTGFVCSNDYVAQRVIQVLEEAGQRVPDDVSVTGFDAALDPTRTRRPTSIDPHFFEIGQVAARLALQRIAHPVGQPCIVNVRGNLVQGDTTAPPTEASIAH